MGTERKKRSRSRSRERGGGRERGGRGGDRDRDRDRERGDKKKRSRSRDRDRSKERKERKPSKSRSRSPDGPRVSRRRKVSIWWDHPPTGFEHITPLQYKAMQGKNPLEKYEDFTFTPIFNLSHRFSFLQRPVKSPQI